MLFFVVLISLTVDGPQLAIIGYLPIPPTATLPSCLLWSFKNLPIAPRFFSPTDFLSRCKFSTLTPRQPLVEFYLTHVFTLSVTEERSDFSLRL